jgi:hypothetical protein
MTRGQMAAFIHRLSGNVALTQAQINSLSSVYTDVNGSELKNDILWMRYMGYTTTSGTYGTNDPVTRGQMAAFMRRLAGSPAFAPTGQELTYYTDVNNSEFRDDILWMARMGITTTRGTYSVDGPVTRGQMAAFLNRFNNTVLHKDWYATAN